MVTDGGDKSESNDGVSIEHSNSKIYTCKEGEDEGK